MRGDFTPGKTIRIPFNTHKGDGTPITLAGTPAVHVYKDGGTTESNAGVTLTVDFDSRTGFHLVTIDTSADGTFYSAGSDFSVVLTAGTVDSISVVGSVVGGFSLSNRSALRPTTADRTLDVSAGGEAGVDWANVGSPTTVVGLSGTTVKTATDVETDTQDIQGRLPAALVGGRIDSSVGAMAANVVTAAAIAADAIGASELAADAVTEIQSGLSTLDAAGVRSAVGLATANLDTQLAAIDDYIDTEIAAIKAKTDNLPASPAATGDIPTASAVADAVWDEAQADHLTAGSTGASLNGAGSAGDPWGTTLPGAYGAGTAGKILGDNLNATVSSRSSHSAADVWAVGTRTLTSFGTLVADVAAAVWAAATRTLTAFGFTVDTNANATELAIKAKTDNLPSDPADESNIQGMLAAIAGYIDTEVAAIKAKTDLIPAAPAAVGDIPTADQNADALLDRANGVAAGYTPRQALLAVLALAIGDESIVADVQTRKNPDGTTSVAFDLLPAGGPYTERQRQ